MKLFNWRSAIVLLSIFGFSITSHSQEQNNNIKLTKNAIDESAGSLPCFKIETPVATYFLEKEGAGLSSMIDKDGNDWLGFHPQPGSGAGGEYRGFPNAVHQQDGSFFHPKNEATEPSSFEVVYEGNDKITLQATTHSKTWQASWDFYPTHCTFTMTRMPSGYKYWILYEGIPGGDYDDSDWWMTSAVKEKQPLTKTHEGDIPAPEWIVFGDQNIERTLFLLHHEDDNETDRFYEMQKKMTVFGFGRKGLEKFLDSVPQRFSVGFLDTTNHTEISNSLLKISLHQSKK